jgi:hypothetical protein
MTRELSTLSRPGAADAAGSDFPISAVVVELGTCSFPSGEQSCAIDVAYQIIVSARAAIQLGFMR